jgi:glycine/D-amino acid oxidase-like deaminating enzyme
MASHVVVGGGVNGLSVAWRLAERGADVVVLDKGHPGAGASGSAGGIVSNYYRSEAITELVAMSVAMFESEPEAYGFRQVGYLAAVPQRQVDDLVAIREQHERAGYESELVVGAERCREYLSWTWADWDAPVEAVLHERRGGWADAM